MALLHGGSPVSLQFRVQEFYGNSKGLNPPSNSMNFLKTPPKSDDDRLRCLKNRECNQQRSSVWIPLFGILFSFIDAKFFEQNQKKDDANQQRGNNQDSANQNIDKKFDHGSSVSFSQ